MTCEVAIMTIMTGAKRMESVLSTTRREPMSSKPGAGFPIRPSNVTTPKEGSREAIRREYEELVRKLDELTLPKGSAG